MQSLAELLLFPWPASLVICRLVLLGVLLGWKWLCSLSGVDGAQIGICPHFSLFVGFCLKGQLAHVKLKHKYTPIAKTMSDWGISARVQPWGLTWCNEPVYPFYFSPATLWLGKVFSIAWESFWNFPFFAADELFNLKKCPVSSLWDRHISADATQMGDILQFTWNQTFLMWGTSLPLSKCKTSSPRFPLYLQTSLMSPLLSFLPWGMWSVICLDQLQAQNLPVCSSME